MHVQQVLSVSHLHQNNILHRSQHGFCKNRSTTTNLLECFNDWTLTVLSKEQHVIIHHRSKASAAALAATAVISCGGGVGSL